MGGGDLIPGSEKEYLTGVFTSFMGPHTGWSTSLTMFRARTIHLLVRIHRWPHCVLPTMIMVQSPLKIIHSCVWHTTLIKNI